MPAAVKRFSRGLGPRREPRAETLRPDIGRRCRRQERLCELNWNTPCAERTNVPLPSLSDIRVVVPDHVVSRVIDGMTVLLDVESGRTFSLDDVGTRAWEALIDAPTAQDALDQLHREYVAEPGELERDLVSLIDRLASDKLVLLQAHRL